MHGLEPGDGLEFDDDPGINEKVDPVSAREADALVGHRHSHLPGEWNAVNLKLASQALLIGRLEQARSQRGMHIDSTADDCASKGIGLDFHTRW